MNAKIIKAAGIALAVAVGAGALCMAGAYVALFRPNFMRRTSAYTPKETQKHFVAQENASRNASDEAWFSAADRVRLELTSYDGLTLVAYYLPHPNAKGIVLMMHGFHSTPMRDFASIARFYYESGYAICLPYQRSHGESAGTYLTYGVQERYDARAWIDELNDRYGMENDIFVHGISMGCATVLMASADKDGYAFPFNVRGVIADCGFTTPREIIRFVLNMRLHRLLHPHKKTAAPAASGAAIMPITPRSYPVSALVTHIGDFYARKLAGFSLDGGSTLSALVANETPVLFIHGTADDFVPLAMTLANYEACHAPKELLLVEGATHAMSFYTDEERYTSAVRAFMERNALPR